MKSSGRILAYAKTRHRAMVIALFIFYKCISSVNVSFVLLMVTYLLAFSHFSSHSG